MLSEVVSHQWTHKQEKGDYMMKEQKLLQYYPVCFVCIFALNLIFCLQTTLFSFGIS